MKTIINTLLIVLFLAVLIPSGNILSQQFLERQFKGYTNPDELVTFSATASFNDAVALLSKVSESTTGKRIVSTVESDANIGIEMTNMPYDKALVVLVQYHGLMYEEKEDVIVIKRKDELYERKPETYASVDGREVKISAVFFEMDVAESKKRGVNWSVILDNNRNFRVGTDLIGGPDVPEGGNQLNPPDFRISPEGNFRIGEFAGEVTAMFRFFEEENLGEIIASPNVTVRDRNKGRIQVGSDISVKQRDFAGNIVETFFPTGTIIEVTPYVYKEDDVDYILLKILVERSSFVQGGGETQLTEIRKTNTVTEVVMLNGEETVIGGLFINEESQIRTGIPILKDLPGWFFGLRYLFGSDETVVRKKELVILLKAELAPTLKERLVTTPSDRPIEDDIRYNNNRLRELKPNRKNIR
jgi:general secretion pathway protein D